MFVYGLVFSPTLSGWINCLSSDKHPSYHPPIVFYIHIFWLNQILKRLFLTLILSLFFCPHPCWSHWSPRSVLSLWHSSGLASSLFSVCINKLFNFLKHVLKLWVNLDYQCYFSEVQQLCSLFAPSCQLQIRQFLHVILEN